MLFQISDVSRKMNSIQTLHSVQEFFCKFGIFREMHYNDLNALWIIVPHLKSMKMCQ